MILRPLTTNERAETPGFTHVGVVGANDLNQATAAAAQAFTLCGIAKKDVVLRAYIDPVVPFQNTADAAFNTCTASLGDGGSAARHVAAVETNANGTPVPGMGNTPFLYLTVENLILTINSMAAKSLKDINRGELHVFVSLFRSRYVSEAIAKTAASKP
jgi:hypothetical protein